MTSNNNFHVWCRFSMLGFTSDSPQISVSLHQLDFAPYASRSYSAQWNVPELLHDMHMFKWYPKKNGG